ncbi:MAG TPA: acyl-CoA dehydrogenase family protein [Polyangia bacterium]|jgi:alkylation response protein AidB-like acyl-CoA dehydrogenase|nr:acyl-CoA dehydrogenase family protein [Polyangia bacterium]
MAGTARRLDRLDTSHTEEQRLIADTARSFAARCLQPRAAERDRTGHYPLEEFRALAELGLLAMKVPAAEGGVGADNVGYVLAMEAIARHARPPRSSSSRAT